MFLGCRRHLLVGWSTWERHSETPVGEERGEGESEERGGEEEGKRGRGMGGRGGEGEGGG